MAYPGNVLPRCAADYITDQLQSAGFNVKIYENIFITGGGTHYTQTPAEVLGSPAGTATYGSINYGEADYGEGWAIDGITLIANYIEEAKDLTFAIPSTNLRSTFFIADPAAITTFATVDLVRKDEFRQLILNLKPQQTIGYMFVNYV